ncbi:Rptn, partial [Symbiodinium microadriaticum]
EALQEIRTYFDTLYHTSPDTCIAQMQPPEQPVRFSVAEFEAALAELPSNKAVPATLPPALLWKTAASCLARRLTPQLNEWLADMTQPPPSEWHVADIFLLLKPGKKPSAAALRPISLLHPVAKALATMLKHRVQPAVNAYLEQLPQYAYTQQRSAQDALDRAFTHCTLVQAILRTQTLTPQARKQGHQVLPCRGGITLSVDFRKAFDLMPREHLLSALSKAKIDDAHCWTIMQLHAHAQMQFSYAQSIPVMEYGRDVG